MDGQDKVPIIIPEGGIDPPYEECSNHTQHVVDKMTLPFTGIAGYSAWGGDAPVYQASASSPVTLPSYIQDKWKTTIRTKNHMNGVDVINILSNTWGAWKQGMGKTHINFVEWNWFGPGGGIYKTFKPELLEYQNYVSSDKTMFTGYVRNRTYNARTRGCLNTTFPDIGEEATYFYTPKSILWNEPPTGNRLKVYNLQQGEDYSVHWYSFKTGSYIKTDCQKATNGSLRLEFPILTASYSGTNDNPVVWFVAERSNCNQSRPAVIDDSTAIVSTRSQINNIRQSMIYPNPFDDYFIVNSLEDDVFMLQAMEGTIIGKYSVLKGENKINIGLPSGIYIGRLLNQSMNFKIIKR